MLWVREKRLARLKVCHFLVQSPATMIPSSKLGMVRALTSRSVKKFVNITAQVYDRSDMGFYHAKTQSRMELEDRSKLQ